MNHYVIILCIMSHHDINLPNRCKMLYLSCCFLCNVVRCREDRMQRVARFKPRLALLLPANAENGRRDSLSDPSHHPQSEVMGKQFWVAKMTAYNIFDPCVCIHYHVHCRVRSQGCRVWFYFVEELSTWQKKAGRKLFLVQCGGLWSVGHPCIERYDEHR